jgi:tRNA-dihydrouridine synthase
VRCEDNDRELQATRILAAAGGRNVHIHGRSPH